MKNEKVYSLFRNTIFLKRLRGFVNDEAHCVSKYCKENHRVDYSLVCEMRSYVPDAPSMSLSGTIHPSIRRDIMSKLGLEEDRLLYLKISSSRPNIYLHNITSPQAFKDFSLLNPVLDLLSAGTLEKNQCRILVFFESQELCGKAHEYACRYLSVDAYSSRVGMYHSKTPEVTKAVVREDCASIRPVLWVLFATSSLRMGANVTLIRYILFYGSPQDVDDFCQSLGRIRETILSGHAIVLTGGYNRKDETKPAKDMKEYHNLEEGQCRRKILAGFYNENCGSVENCCDGCNSRCECELCHLLGHFYVGVTSRIKPSSPIQHRKVQVERLEKRLLEYRQRFASNNEVFFTNLDLASALPLSIIQDIVDNANYIENKLDLQQYTLRTDSEHLTDVFNLIEACTQSN
eukprot:Lithocolla_globosa_v1_NODE_40_length_8230_cov_45.875581.p2 type:complete len:404 gc:universal NODE_40_length_8230_cov_45.875581:1380-169(-)